MNVSIIVPVLNEGLELERLLQSIQSWRRMGHEIILIDAGSENNRSDTLEHLTDKIINTVPGRALQMNQGAIHARHEVLFFLHADSTPNQNSIHAIQCGLENSKRVWGRFNIQLSGRHWLLRIIEKMMNLRSRLTGIATGDQGIFVYAETFKHINGYARIELMEDIEISKRLKKISSPVCLRQRIITSSRKWEQKGILKTVILMWLLRLAYFFGVSPYRLRSIYYST